MIIYESIFLKKSISKSNQLQVEEHYEINTYKDYWINRIYWVLSMFFTIMKYIVAFKTNIFVILIIFISPIFRFILITLPNMNRFFRKFGNFLVRIIMISFSK